MHTHRYGVLLKMVREAVRKGEWKKPGWKDPGFEAQFADLINEVSAIVETKRTKVRLVLPVKFAEVSYPGTPGPGTANRPRKALRIVSGDIKLAGAIDSIILADGNVFLGGCYGCIIFARGAVDVVGGQGNLIIAGHFIDMGGDGDRHPEGPNRPRSLLMAGSCLSISNSRNTICHTRLQSDVSHVDKTVFLNTPHVPYYHDRDYSAIYDHSFRFFDNYKLLSSQRSKRFWVPLHQDLLMVKAEWTPEPKRMLQLHFKYRGKGNVTREAIIRQGDYVKDEKGQPAPELAGWRLSFLSEAYALFTKGQEDAAFRIPLPKKK
ncbi:MAG: hypothetical protein HYX68_22460 [Planctomycetes bacterium]|nr:hypothetical protein [Planctomycetota bacterium]